MSELLKLKEESNISFYLNEYFICTKQNPTILVLDYLRNVERLTGTKEGCREGGCGACVVLMGELKNSEVVYKPVPSCLLPLGELQGKHLVTIEGLNQSSLSSVQQAIIEEGASQCGFCTPGIVVSLTGYLIANSREIKPENLKQVLSGHICRCTGYASLKRAINSLVTNQTNLIPAYFQDILNRLQELSISIQEAKIEDDNLLMAGGTILYVDESDHLDNSKVKFLNLLPHWKEIKLANNQIEIGALITLAELANNPIIADIIPEIETYLQKVASWQVRNRATVGGNIIAKSPVADITILLLVLDAQLVFQNHLQTRIVSLKQFYQAANKTNLIAGEILTKILIPNLSKDTKINWEKVSKRPHLDVASVNSAIKITCENYIISELKISLGGVAPKPLLLETTTNYLIGKPLTATTIKTAFPLLQSEISPISDVHGSEKYKRLLARQLLIAHFTKLYPELIQLKDLL